MDEIQKEREMTSSCRFAEFAFATVLFFQLLLIYSYSSTAHKLLHSSRNYFCRWHLISKHTSLVSCIKYKHSPPQWGGPYVCAAHLVSVKPVYSHNPSCCCASPAPVFCSPDAVWLLAPLPASAPSLRGLEDKMRQLGCEDTTASIFGFWHYD